MRIIQIATTKDEAENDLHGKKDGKWIGVDLDGTLAEYHGWKGPEHIGKPVKRMLDRVEKWLGEGKAVKILTARVSPTNGDEAKASRKAIEAWLEEHLGEKLEITHEKDSKMDELWDDRAVQVVKNTGERVDGKD